MRRFSIFILVTIVLLTLYSSPLNETVAWGGNSHQFLVVVAADNLNNVVDSLGINGERWPQLFQIYESEYKLGAVAPDRVFGDSTNHIYHVDPPNPYTNAPNKVREWYESFKSNILSENYSYAVWSAGVMSHYLLDLCQPMHTDEVWKEDDGSENGGVSGHRKYEQDGNTKIDSIVFQNYTPILLSKSVEATTIDCAYYSNNFHDDLVETYWNGSFWTPWVEEATTDLLNYGVRALSNMLFTAISEVNVTLPDFTPLAINMNIDIPTQIYRNTKYTGTINLVDWQEDPLDANIIITRTLVNYLEDNASNEETASIGPFIILHSREEIGVYSFEMNISVTGTVELEFLVTKKSMISKYEVLEVIVVDPVITSDPFSSESLTTTATSEENVPSFSVGLAIISIIGITYILRRR